MFFGSFDPVHKGHISIIKNAIKAVKADTLYLGLNKTSKKGKLTSFYKRKAMLKEFAKKNKKYKVLNFSFDYNNLDLTYAKIFELIKNKEAYILVGEDQLANLKYWYKYDELIKNCKFIIARRGNNIINQIYLSNPNYIFIDHNYQNISSALIRKGKYKYTIDVIKDYILDNNLYLKEQIKPYFDRKERYLHTLSVAKTALLINKKGNLMIDSYVVEKAALLHDIAKDMSNAKSNKIMKEYYPQHANENELIIHQYLGEYLAHKDFYVKNTEILNAIKWHTTGRENMTLLEKLIYVADKIEPRRKKYCDCDKYIAECIRDFNNGFITVLKYNKEHLDKKGGLISKNKTSVECFNYYLK